MLFYLDLTGKIFFQKNFQQKLRHRVVEAETLRVEAKAIQKLPLPHPGCDTRFTFKKLTYIYLKSSKISIQTLYFQTQALIEN